MKRYSVSLARSAQNQLRAIRDVRLRDALEREIHALADPPRPPGCVEMSESADEWRIRVGEWRVVYRIDDGRVVVVVVRVAPRGGVYR